MYLVKSLPYDPARDFAAVAMVCDRGPILVTLNPDMPIKTFPELIAYGKTNPGKLSYAVDASGGFALATARLLNKRGQIGMVEVPYRSQPPDGAGHHLRNNAPAGGLDASDRWRREGGQASVDRSQLRPSFPRSRRHAHYRGNASWVSHRRLVCSRRPRRNARRNLAAINREIDAVFKSPEIRQRALGFGLVVSDAGTPELTAQFIKGEQERWRDLVQELGMEAQ